MKNNHKYKLIYKMVKKPNGMVKERVPNGWGGCDAVLFCSIIYPEDGSLSIYYMGVDGRKYGEIQENLEDIEWFDASFFGDPAHGDNGPQRTDALLNTTTSGFSALDQYGGTVIKTSLSDEDTAKLQEALNPEAVTA